ncbi:hypothetical protein ILUMI_09928, partial [Ignelater luminosus]
MESILKIEINEEHKTAYLPLPTQVTQEEPDVMEIILKSLTKEELKPDKLPSTKQDKHSLPD